VFSEINRLFKKETNMIR